MTRREFDRLTKRNWGAFHAAQWSHDPVLLADWYRWRKGRRLSYMASDERENYRYRRCLPAPDLARDRIADRAAEVASDRAMGLGRDGPDCEHFAWHCLSVAKGPCQPPNVHGFIF